MEKIIQINESEYNRIIDKANMIDKEIESEAIKLYKRDGIHGIRLTITVCDNEDDIFVESRGFVNSWDSKFPINTNDAKNILSFVNRRAEELFERRFGQAIYNMKYIKKESKLLSQRKKTFMVFTFTGWLTALLMVIINSI